MLLVVLVVVVALAVGVDGRERAYALLVCAGKEHSVRGGQLRVVVFAGTHTCDRLVDEGEHVRIRRGIGGCGRV